MRRLFHTSAGPLRVEFDPDHHPLVANVEFRAFDPRDRWLGSNFVLFEFSKPDLSEFLSESIGIPEDEAHRLFHELRYDMLVEWEDRLPADYRSYQQAVR